MFYRISGEPIWFAFFRLNHDMIDPVLSRLCKTSKLVGHVRSGEVSAALILPSSVRRSAADDLARLLQPLTTDWIGPLMVETFSFRRLVGQARIQERNVDTPCIHRDAYVRAATALLRDPALSLLSGPFTGESTFRSLAQLIADTIITLSPGMWAAMPHETVRIRDLTPWFRCEAIRRPRKKEREVVLQSSCRPRADGEPLHGCSRCLSVAYCGPGQFHPLCLCDGESPVLLLTPPSPALSARAEHQRIDWMIHKTCCKAPLWRVG